MQADTHFDPGATDFIAAPEKTFSRLRATSPAVRHGTGKWSFVSVFTYDLVKSVLANPGVWSSAIPEFEDLVLGDAAIMIQDDPPKHTRYRSIVARLLAATLESYVGDRLSAEMRPLLQSTRGRTVEFLDEVASPLAAATVCDIIGLAVCERDRIRNWARRLSESVGLEMISTDEMLLEQQRVRVRELHVELTDFLRCHLRACRSGGGTSATFVRGLLAAGITDLEVCALMKSMIIGGNATTSGMLTNAAVLFAEHPEALRLLHTQATLVEPAVEEVLRMRGVFRGVQRVATESSRLGSVAVEQGVYVLAWIASANFDESMFDDPLTFDITRTPNPHMAFGYGPHYCVGAPLARLQLRAFVEYLCREVDGVEIKQLPVRYQDPWAEGYSSASLRFV